MRFKFIIILALISSSLTAQERSIFSADRYIRKVKEHKVVLEENVKVLKGESVLYADYVELNTDTEEFTAKGNVIFKGSNFEMHGDEMTSSMNSAKGVLKKGYVISNFDRIDGTNIERKARGQLSIKEGRYTSCKNSPPDWRFYGNQIDLTVGEYSYMNNVIVEGWSVPIAYIPYLVLPIKTKRQTGFLPPHFSFGDDGFGLHESLFIALNRSNDATLTLGHYNNRGFKQGFEYRYSASERSDGSFYLFHIKDKKFSNIKLSDGQTLERKNRESLKFDNVTALGDVTYARTKIRYASDSNLPRDFTEEIDGRSDAALESKILLSSKSQNASYTGQAVFYQDLLSTNPLNFNKNQIHRFPELSMNIAKVKYSKFMFEGDVSYLHIYRPSPFYDDTNLNSIYDADEFIRTGHRFDFFPRVSMPLTTKFIKITPQAGLRYDFYTLPTSGTAHKGYAEIKTDFSSEITSIYQRDKGTHYRAIKHAIEPFVTHRVIPNTWKTNHPFFDTVSSTGLQAPMFDSIDNVKKTNSITYGVTNRILAKYIENPTPMVIEEDDKTRETTASAIENNINNPVTVVDDPEQLCTSNDELLEWIKQREESKQNAEKNKALITKNPMEIDDSELATTEKPAYLEENTGSEAEVFTVIQPIQWKVYQSYDFSDTTGRPFSYLYSDLYASYSWVGFAVSNFYNFYTHKMGLNGYLNLTPYSRSYLRIGYSYNKTETNVSVNQIRFGVGLNFWRFGTSARFIFNNEVKGSIGEKIQDRYFDVMYYPPSSCWFLQVSAQTPYDKPGFHFTFTFNLIISGQSVGFMPGQGAAWSKL